LCAILCRTDSTTALAYINKYGGCKSIQCHQIAKQIWQWCEYHNIIIFASYINTKANLIAEEVDSYDFKLERKYFEKICDLFYLPTIDLFATCHTSQCPKFVSWFPSPGALWVDAFTETWNDVGLYAFPPFKLLTRVLKKIRHDKFICIVVAPDWPNQPWYPLFQQLRISEVIILHPTKDLLFCPYSNRNHPLSLNTRLMAAVLSINHSKI
jgi:hypothetical protein